METPTIAHGSSVSDAFVIRIADPRMLHKNLIFFFFLNLKRSIYCFNIIMFWMPCVLWHCVNMLESKISEISVRSFKLCR